MASEKLYGNTFSSVHLRFVKNDQNIKANVNNTVCIASQKNVYCLYPPHSTSVNKEVIDDFGGNCNGVCVSEEKGKGSVVTIPDRYELN